MSLKDEGAIAGVMKRKEDKSGPGPCQDVWHFRWFASVTDKTSPSTLELHKRILKFQSGFRLVHFRPQCNSWIN